ncbi:AAA family ATPase [Euzebya sp.]|uniref:MinD/ParA family ATP-binding protein n=1 Tax=Euzebya sp. TaxID=1971409 RepID=UPI0035111F63
MRDTDDEGEVGTASGGVWSAVSTTLDGPPPPPPTDPFSIRVDEVGSGPVVDFDHSAWVEARNPAPVRGWRRWLWRVTGGRFRPNPTAEERRSRQLLAAARRPFTGARTIAVISTKGGVGKTTTALNLGHTLAMTRGDRVVALDANPDAGSLGYRVARETDATALDLLAYPEEITGYAQIRGFTSQAPSRLEVIASPDDPRLTRRLGRDEYERLLGILRLQYNLVVADCGTGILDSATRGVVQAADQLVVVTGPSVDAARAVTYLLAWLREHGMADMVADAVVVINGVRDGRRPVDVTKVVDHFRALVRDVVVVPFDVELANGAAVELEWLDVTTRQAYLELAGVLVDAFVADDAAPPAHHPDPTSAATGRITVPGTTGGTD